jgi:hypothetical protein
LAAFFAVRFAGRFLAAFFAVRFAGRFLAAFFAGRFAAFLAVRLVVFLAVRFAGRFLAALRGAAFFFDALRAVFFATATLPPVSLALHSLQSPLVKH